MNIFKTLLTRYNQTKPIFKPYWKWLIRKLCGWCSMCCYGYDVCLAWLWIQLRTTTTIEIRLFMIWINAWFVSFLMWVHHLIIDDILDDQDWIVHLVNIKPLLLGLLLSTWSTTNDIWIPKFWPLNSSQKPKSTNLFANKCEPSIRTILAYFVESSPYNVFCVMPPSPKT
jgi:hypothetical protein